MARNTFLFAILGLLPLPPSVNNESSQKSPTVAGVPLFSTRVRVVAASGKAPAGKQFAFHMRSTLMQTSGDGWSPWWKFEADEAKKSFRGSYPVMIALQITRLTEPVSLE